MHRGADMTYVLCIPILPTAAPLTPTTAPLAPTAAPLTPTTAPLYIWWRKGRSCPAAILCCILSLNNGWVVYFSGDVTSGKIDKIATDECALWRRWVMDVVRIVKHFQCSCWILLMIYQKYSATTLKMFDNPYNSRSCANNAAIPQVRLDATYGSIKIAASYMWNLLPIEITKINCSKYVFKSKVKSWLLSKYES